MAEELGTVLYKRKNERLSIEVCKLGTLTFNMQEFLRVIVAIPARHMEYLLSFLLSFVSDVPPGLLLSPPQVRASERFTVLDPDDKAL